MVKCTIDEQGNVYQTRTEIDRGELAPPVRQAFERMFDVDNIKWTYRTQYQFYEFQQDTPQGPVTFRVRPTGTIMSVQAPEAERDDEAVTARFKEGERQRNDQDTPGAVIGRDRQDRDQND